MIKLNWLSDYLLHTFPGLKMTKAWGETSFFYNPHDQHPLGIYFCTIKEHDGPNDKASALHRENVYRFNFGITKPTFLKLFQAIPKRPAKGDSIDGTYDFQQIDILQPHPIYGWMCWVAINNPSETSFKQLTSLLSESYQLVVQKHVRKIRRDSSKHSPIGTVL